MRFDVQVTGEVVVAGLYFDANGAESARCLVGRVEASVGRKVELLLNGKT